MEQEIILEQTNHTHTKHILENKWGFIGNDDIITAVGKPRYFCVGIVDIVNSTKTVAKLSPYKVPKYYEIFLNTMAKPVNYYHGKILKVMGDSLLFYFQDLYYHNHKFDFLNSIECGFSIMNMHKKLNTLLRASTIPEIDFRISFDYGSVTVMKTRNGLIDLVGPTINTCAKINDLAPINGVVIGGDFYEKVKRFHKYRFKHTGNFSIGLKQSYPVFTLYRKIK